MKEITKKEVLEYLVLKGNNAKEVEAEINKHFDFAIAHYSTIKKISMYIICN